MEPSARPDDGRLIDRYGRVATDLRVSLTDRCNLRCSYCMPPEGLPWLPAPEILTDDEVIRLIGVAVRLLGVAEVRFTGGEPLLRPGLTRIIAAAAALRPRPVLLRGVNDDEAPALLRFALEHGYELRFIEQMPLDAQQSWDRAQMVTAAEILDALRAEFTLLPDPAERGGAPAETWLVDGSDGPHGGLARVGVIGTVTRPFCGDCDRTRLTADGQVRDCLFARHESDLRGALRSGADDEELGRRWRTAMWGKRAGHGIDDPSFLQPARPMSAIGG